MTTMTIYDPAMCCSTGICGPEVDPKLAQFAGDLDWLKTLGIDVKRINLSQEPTLFAENEQVKTVLEKSGVEGLPVIIVGDALLSSGQYPARDELTKMAGLTPGQVSDAAATEVKASGCCGGDSDTPKTSSSCC